MQKREIKTCSRVQRPLQSAASTITQAPRAASTESTIFIASTIIIVINNVIVINNAIIIINVNVI